MGIMIGTNFSSFYFYFPSKQVYYGRACDTPYRVIHDYFLYSGLDYYTDVTHPE